MRLVKLKRINLLYSNISEEDYPVWNDSSTYAKGDCVIVTDVEPHKVFESLVGSNTGNYPPDTCWFDLEANYPEWDKNTTYSVGDRVKVTLEKDGITPRFPQAFESLTDNNKGNYPPDDTTNWKSLDKWRDLGATNRWKMFDSLVKTQTVATNEIDVVVGFPLCDTFCLFGLEATSLEWYLYDGSYTNESNLVASGKIDNLQEPVPDWFEYFFSEIVYKQDVYVGGIPLYQNGQLRVKIKKDGTVKCGMMVIGRSYKLGETLFDARVSILDYSVKEVDEQGNATLRQGNFVKQVECDVWLYNKWIDWVRKELASVRATPVVFNFNNNSSCESLIVYGFYRDFEITIPSEPYSRCTIRVEGLI